MRYDFASDNTSGLCPEAWEAMQEAGQGCEPSYGEDRWTAAAAERIRSVFETDCDVYFVFNGTAANSLALASLCQSYHSVLCHEASHIETDECGAPEFFSNGTKLLTLPGAHGKFEPDAVAALATKRTDLHFPKAKVLSLTESTEFGTVYSPTEVGALGEVAKSNGLRVHMDGARFANAVAALGCAPREITWEAGVDVLCFGGTKLGMGLGEAVVFFDREASAEFAFRCKQAGQLSSKMRFAAAPWDRMLGDGSWLTRAAHANAMATRLADRVRDLEGVEVLHAVDVNGVFADLSEEVRSSVRGADFMFYDFIGGGSRFMSSWATTEADVDALAAAMDVNR